MLKLVVLGVELAVPYSRNPLKRGCIPSAGSKIWKAVAHFDRAPRNKRSRTSSGPEGSSDKWRSLCRGPIPVISMHYQFHKDSTAGAQPFFLLAAPAIPESKTVFFMSGLPVLGRQSGHDAQKRVGRRI